MRQLVPLVVLLVAESLPTDLAVERECLHVFSHVPEHRALIHKRLATKIALVNFRSRLFYTRSFLPFSFWWR